MLEARLRHATTLKKMLESVKDLVGEVNFDCNDTGISMQCMDSAHVCLVAFLLRSTGFEHYRCDRNLSLGISLANLNKMLRSVGPDDILLLRADDKGDQLTMIFENSKTDRVSEYELKLMNIDAEYLGIPTPDYDVNVTMSAAEFKRIVSDMGGLSECISISVTKEGVNFSAEGDIGNGSITLKPGAGDSIDDEEDSSVVIEMKSAVGCIFSTKYLSNFTKATGLSNQISLGLSMDIPSLFEYKVSDVGYVRYYIASKVEEEE